MSPNPMILRHFRCCAFSGKPVAVLSPYRPPIMTAERKKTIQHAIDVMAKGLPWGNDLRKFVRDEMHER